MATSEHWPLLRGGRAEREEGLRILRERYDRDPQMYHLDFGIGLLWLEFYDEAWAHFRKLIQTDFVVGDVHYGMAGVAQWCLGLPREAVLEWRAGLKGKYARAGGLNIVNPLLLYFAAVIEPEVYEQGAALKLLLEKSKDKRSHKWPASLSNFVLGQMTKEEILQSFQSKVPKYKDLWYVEFYENLMNRNHTGIPRSSAMMRGLADTTHPELQDHNEFSCVIWSEEFYLARYDGRKGGAAVLT